MGQETPATPPVPPIANSSALPLKSLITFPVLTSKLTTLKGKQANALFWSPSGHYILLAGLKGFNGQLEFYNVDELETMATTEHFMATDIEWDPTGR